MPGKRGAARSEMKSDRRFYSNSTGAPGVTGGHLRSKMWNIAVCTAADRSIDLLVQSSDRRAMKLDLGIHQLTTKG
jgi:hypothetical protein